MTCDLFFPKSLLHALAGAFLCVASCQGEARSGSLLCQARLLDRKGSGAYEASGPELAQRL